MIKYHSMPNIRSLITAANTGITTIAVLLILITATTTITVAVHSRWPAAVHEPINSASKLLVLNRVQTVLFIKAIPNYVQNSNYNVTPRLLVLIFSTLLTQVLNFNSCISFKFIFFMKWFFYKQNMRGQKIFFFSNFSLKFILIL